MKKNDETEIQIKKEITKFSSSLNNYLRTEAKVSESDRSLVVAACLFALENDRFQKGYRNNRNSKDLLRDMFSAIESTFEKRELRENQRNAILPNLNFMKSISHFNNDIEIDNRYPEKYPLLYTLDKLKEEIYPYLVQGKDLDILGKFYSEFLKSANGDGKGLGIVLTPEHITKLFCKLADLKVDDIVVDTCTGSGAFILAAGNYMINLTDDKHIKQNIKDNNLYGIEVDSKMFTLLSTNMLIRGKNVKNIYKRSTFDMVDIMKKKRVNKALINPPYSQGGNETELNFIENMLDMLTPSGIGVCIVPISVATKVQTKTKKLRDKIFKKHSLLSVMKMNTNLFYKVGTHPIIMVWKAHEPHVKINPDGSRKINKRTWFADWSNDGLVSVKNQGRLDINNRWKDIENQWIHDYEDNVVKQDYSAYERVDIDDEWIIDNFLEPDWNQLNDVEFEKSSAAYIKFKEE